MKKPIRWRRTWTITWTWKYDVKAQECINLATKPSNFSTEDSCKWFLHQAKIFQKRAVHIRQEWAKQGEAHEAKEATRNTPPQSTQSETQSSTKNTRRTPPQSNTQQSQQMKKRNQKTRLQHKRRALQVTVQEVEHPGVQTRVEASK